METINEFATKYAQDKYLPVQTYNAVKVVLVVMAVIFAVISIVASFDAVPIQW